MMRHQNHMGLWATQYEIPNQTVIAFPTYAGELLEELWAHICPSYSQSQSDIHQTFRYILSHTNIMIGTAYAT